MIATLHYDDNVDERTSKPEIILFYNQTKSVVGIVNRMSALYSVSRLSHRQPLTLFFSLLIVGAVDMYIIYKNNNDSSIKQRNFLKEIST
jgi:hypothetical protein